MRVRDVSSSCCGLRRRRAAPRHPSGTDCKQTASIIGVATLYVRNVPPELYAELQRWASDSGRSVNAEVLSVLDREAAARAQHEEWRRRLRSEITPATAPPWPEDLIRDDRDHGHRRREGV